MIKYNKLKGSLGLVLTWFTTCLLMIYFGIMKRYELFFLTFLVLAMFGFLGSDMISSLIDKINKQKENNGRS
jgi:multisubunit Na+/H+ antiporter MnhF subunit